MLDGEILEHSSQLIYLSRQIEISEHVRSRAQNIMREVEHDLERVQFHISTAVRHCEELQRSYEDICQLSLRLRDEEERYGLISMSEGDAAEDLRSQAMAAESSAERARKDLDVRLGTWVNDCVGARRGDTGVGQLCLPLDCQLKLCNWVRFTNYMSYFLSSPRFSAIRISETILFTSSAYG